MIKDTGMNALARAAVLPMKEELMKSIPVVQQTAVKKRYVRFVNSLTEF